MNKITYNNIVNHLINQFPEFIDYDKDNLDIPHVIVGNLAGLIIKKIENNSEDGFVINIYNFINDLFLTSDDKKLLDLMKIELFENLAQSERAILFSRKNLKGKAVEYFENAVNSFGIKSMRLK